MEKDPAEQVGDLTQAAAVDRRQAAVLLRQGVAVRRFAVGIADAVPEGERLAGFDQEPVQQPVADNVVGKVVSGLNWYVVCKVSGTDSLQLEIGEKVDGITMPFASTGSIPAWATS